MKIVRQRDVAINLFWEHEILANQKQNSMTKKCYTSILQKMLLVYPQVYLSNYPCFIYLFITNCYIPKSYSISGHEYDLNFCI